MKAQKILTVIKKEKFTLRHMVVKLYETKERKLSGQ